VLTVNSLSDSATPPSNVLTLREALQVVDTGSTAGLSAPQLAQINQTQPLGTDDTIVFDPALTANGPATVDLGIVGDDTFGPSALLVTAPVSIIGPSGPNGLTLARDTTADPNGLRLFYVTSSGNLTLQNLTLSGGLAQGGSSNSGGGAAGLGGAVVNAGSLTLLDDTVSGNQAIGGSSHDLDAGFGGGGLGGNAPGEFVGGPPNGGGESSPGGFGGGGGAGALGGFGGGGGGGGGVGGFGGGGGNGAGGATSHPLGGFGGGNGGDRRGSGGGGAGMGGGIFNYGGTLTLTNSTLADNTAQGGSSGGNGGGDGSGFGGAIFNLNGAVTITYSTLADNVASTGGGAIYNLGDNGVATQNGPALPSNTAAVSLVNSILAGSKNGSGSSVSDFVTNTTTSGTQATSGENNLIQTDPGNFTGGTDTLTGNPNLGPLQDNGGPTETMAVTSSSPAYQVAAPISGITTDQRGYVRPTTDPSLGAFDPLAAAPTTTTADDATATFGATSVTLSATVTEDNSTTPVAEGQVQFTVVNSSNGQTVGTAATGTVNNSGGASVSYGLPGGPLYTPVGSYTIEADYSDSAGNFTASSDSTHTLTVNAATPTLSVSDAGGPYTGNPYAASATAVGVDGKTPVNGSFTFTYYSGNTASGTPLSGPPTNPGTYTVVAAFTSSDPNYISGGTAQTTFTIGKATPTVSVTDAGGTYNGNPFPANGTALGVDGTTPVNGNFTFTYYSGSTASGTPLAGAPLTVGTYTVVAAFTSSDPNYSNGTPVQTTFTIRKATPIVLVMDAGGIYNGKPFPATVLLAGMNGQFASSLEGVTPTLTYYAGRGTAGVNLGATPPSNAGTYTVVASFAGSSDYSSASAPTTFTINAAAATIQLTGVTVVPNLLAFNQTETIAVHVSGPGGVNQGTVTFSVDGKSVSASVNANGDATASLTLPLLTAASPQSISASFSGPNRLSAGVSQTALWDALNDLLPSVDTFSADGSQSVQSYVLGLPLLDFLYTMQSRLTEVVFGLHLLSWNYSYSGVLTVVTLDGMLPVKVIVSTAAGPLMFPPSS
jgi:hypothetical protein